MIKSIIFDMDGVLIDAREWHFDALNKALDIFGYQIGRTEHLEIFDGLPTGQKLQLLSKDRNLPVGLHSFINEMKQEYTFEITISKCRPTFAHQMAMSELKRRGYTLAVASNSIRDTVELMMKKSDLDQYLDLKIAATDVSRAKPDPEIYLTAMDRLKNLPHEVLIVEDSQHGIEAALASGAHVLRINEIKEVNLKNILQKIDLVEGNF